jgi:hypothetical protein
MRSEIRGYRRSMSIRYDFGDNILEILRDGQGPQPVIKGQETGNFYEFY